MKNRRSWGWLRNYRLMDYSFGDYLLRLILPFAALGILTLFFSLLLSDVLGPLRYLMYALSAFFPVIGALYPNIWTSARRRELEQNLHLFITHLGVMAATGIEMVEIFRKLSEKEEEYGPLAEEARKITNLIDTWNRSLDEACRIVSGRTVSPILSDFLERMAHSVEAGQDIHDFIMEEQNVVMSDYESMYEGSLDMLSNYRGLFVSITLAAIFFIVFGTLIPFISGISPLFLIGGAITIFAVAEVGFLLATAFTMPNDPVWGDTKMSTPRDVWLGRGEILSIVLFLGFVVFITLQLLFHFPFSPNPSIPLPIYVAMPITPLAIPGVMTWFEERKTKNRDKNFPSFIRTLGASATARATTSTEILKELRKKDFAMLTENIRNLYKRLRTRIDRKLAWDFFSAESGSFLIGRFSDMYFEGTDAGGDPREVSELISSNFKRIMRIREKRFAAAKNLMGVLYGITVGAVASLFIGFFIAIEMVDVIGSTLTGPLANIFFLNIYDILGIRFLILVVILINALLCSLYIRIVNSSREVSSYLHMVTLFWVGIIIGFLAEIGAEFFVTI